MGLGFLTVEKCGEDVNLTDSAASVLEDVAVDTAEPTDTSIEPQEAVTIDSFSETPDDTSISVEHGNIFSNGQNIFIVGQETNGDHVLIQNDPISGETNLITKLGHHRDKDFGNLIELENGLLAITYQSTEGLNQTSDYHGLVIVDPINEDIVIDIPFYNYTNPSDLIESDGLLFVLCSNRQINSEPAVVILDSTSLAYPEIEILENIPSTSIRNASSLSAHQTENGLTLQIHGTTTESPVEVQTNGSGGVLENDTSGSSLNIHIAFTHNGSLEIQYGEESTTGPNLAMTEASDGSLTVLTGTQTDTNHTALGLIDQNTGDIQTWSLEQINPNANSSHGSWGTFLSGADVYNGIVATSYIRSGQPYLSFLDSETGNTRNEAIATPTTIVSQPAFIEDSDGNLASACLLLGGTGIDANSQKTATLSCYDIDQN